MTERWTPQELAEYVNKNPRALKSNPLAAVKTSKPLKFKNKRTEVDGITFDSKREASRYQDLAVMEKHGLISDLRRQVVYRFNHNGVHIGSYRADFEYLENGQKITEDVKGVRTREYTIKKNLMLALHGITIRET